MFSQVNEFFKAKGELPKFVVQLVGIRKETLLTGGLFTAHADAVLAGIKRTDLIIIPALDGDLQQAVEQNREFIPWIVKQYDNGAEVASLCLGAFLLASTVY